MLTNIMIEIHCVFVLQKQYKIPKIPFSIPSVGVKVNGVLKMKVNVTEKNTKIGCLEMKIYIA